MDRTPLSAGQAQLFCLARAIVRKLEMGIGIVREEARKRRIGREKGVLVFG